MTKPLPKHSSGGVEPDRPHRRYNQLTGEWVLVSPQRNNRPWQGATEVTADAVRSAHDRTCYLCPGNTRVTGQSNPPYTGPYVFPNDFPALLPGQMCPEATGATTHLLRSTSATGEARVICYSERHDLAMARLTPEAISEVVACWSSQYDDLSEHYAYVSIFENRGAAMGCSNPHPHGQVWATDFVPTEVEKEEHQQKTYYRTHKRALLADIADTEERLGERLVFATDDWLCLVPFWAAWPFETLLLPRGSAARFSDLDPVERSDLALALKKLTTRYDNLFQTEFPYSMGWHPAPGHDVPAPHWRLHAHFYPPLLRSASVRKFMVGFELLAEAQRDLTAEQAADILRQQDERHYLEWER
ncbi:MULTISPECIES: UDP-glucose--hexose-1-phosphate uridylyltransferase [unclassified Phaeobacter]|uniref:UDP-glucose--hexose-1-phosphate uridylyltransferase n=1 Tax=unclassified Phaeobacter TaxID=2621772 RepID=UPI003A8542F7